MIRLSLLILSRLLIRLSGLITAKYIRIVRVNKVSRVLFGSRMAETSTSLACVVGMIKIVKLPLG